VVGTIKHVEVDIQAKLDDFRLASKENEDKARHWDKELAKLCKERAAAHGESGEPAPELLTEEELAHFSTDAQNMVGLVQRSQLERGRQPNDPNVMTELPKRDDRVTQT
jgi:plasmid stabilization system protein ParE